MAFSPDGQTLAVGDVDGSTLLLSPGTGVLINRVLDPGVSDGVTALAFSSHGQTLAAADGNGSTYLWKLATGKLASVLADPDSGGTNAVAFSPDGANLATADRSGITHLWNPGGGHTLTAQNEATAINTLLVNSAQSKSQFNANTLVANTGNCVDIDSDVTQIGDIAHERQTELNQAETLQVGAIPNGTTLKTQLMTALQISLTIDNDYLNWAGSSTVQAARQAPTRPTTRKPRRRARGQPTPRRPWCPPGT